ncbi:unnamed protein product, partial [Hapterophycus canaliculatus]
ALAVLEESGHTRIVNAVRPGLVCSLPQTARCANEPLVGPLQHWSTDLADQPKHRLPTQIHPEPRSFCHFRLIQFLRRARGDQTITAESSKRIFSVHITCTYDTICAQ